MSLGKTHLSLLSTSSAQEDQSQYKWKIVDWDVKNQIKQTKQSFNKHVYSVLKQKFSYINLIAQKMTQTGISFGHFHLTKYA